MMKPPDFHTKNRRLARAILHTDHNGRAVAPAPDDEWTAQVRAAVPAAQVAIAVGARARAERAERRVVELEAELAAVVAEPDPRQVFADKNRRLLAAVLASDENGRPITDTPDSTDPKEA